jgi:hypothetical protein
MYRTTLFIVLLSISTLSSVSAQKFKKGTLDFLKTESKVNLVFDFSEMMIDGYLEENYIKTVMANERTPERAQQWKEQWQGPQRIKFLNAFTQSCNDELNKLVVSASYTDAKYTIIIKIVTINSGYFAGPISRPAMLRADFKIVQTNDMDTVLAQLALKKVSIDEYAHISPISHLRIVQGFGALGKLFGYTLNKAVR